MRINNKIFLVHGDLSSLDQLSGSLKPLFGEKVVIPNKEQIFLIK